jgi:hypothetical protein
MMKRGFTGAIRSRLGGERRERDELPNDDDMMEIEDVSA